jgi:hypothetical protein
MINSDLKNKIIYLNDKGINVSSLLEWYFYERSINEGVGDWFKSLWSNVKHAKDNWGGPGKDLGNREKQDIDTLSWLIVNLKRKYGDRVDDQISKILDDAIKRINSIVYDPTFKTTVGAGSKVGSGTDYVKSGKPPKMPPMRGEKGRYIKASTEISSPRSGNYDPLIVKPSSVSSFTYGDSTNNVGLSFKEWMNELQ